MKKLVGGDRKLISQRGNNISTESTLFPPKNKNIIKMERKKEKEKKK